MRIPEDAHPKRQSDPPRRELAIGYQYFRAIEEAGGLPVILPPLESQDVGPILDRVAGLCLSGGPDLSPDTYGAKPHRMLGPTEPEIDRFEILSVRRADERGLPVLGICRGAQVLNVARGGTLYQHLPGRKKVFLEHRQHLFGSHPTHWVDIEPGSTLGRAIRRRRVRVNSFHHQAPRKLGKGLRAVAWAEDGVVEGVEATDRDFVVGVQWHAEGLTARREHASLFRTFVDAARAHVERSAQAA